MLLSIGMMVKNEEKHLEKCLNSLKPILNKIESELIIIDTGSEDKTIEIAKKYTDKLYFHKWNNDFSAMRNKVLEYCKGKWVLIIDGDEVIDRYDDLIEFFDKKEYSKYNSATLVGKNLIDYDDLSKYSTLDTLRLFKKDKDFRYNGAVHNQPTWKKPIKVLSSSLFHYGYILSDKELMEKKFKRTSAILISELNKEPDNFYYRFQLSVTYSMHGDLIQALIEIEKAYNALISLRKDKERYRYIYTQYSSMLLNNNRYDKCEEIAREGIAISNTDRVDKIDLYYYLAKAQTKLNKRTEAIKSYYSYLDLLDKYERKNIILDMSITSYTLQYADNAYQELINIYLQEESWDEIRNILHKINRKDIISALYKVIWKCFRELKDYRGLYNYYKNKIKPIEISEVNEFLMFIEKDKINLSKEECLNIDREFADLMDEYGELNRIRVKLSVEGESEVNIPSSLIEKVKENKAEFFYGDLLYYKLVRDEEINSLLENSDYNSIKDYFIYIFNKYEDFTSVLLKYIKNIKEINLDEFKDIKLIKIYLRYLLIKDSLSDEEFKYVFDLYIEYGIKYIKYVYSDYLLENELVNECKNQEDIFHIYILKALEIKNKDKITYVRYLEMALKTNESMNKGIKILLDNAEEKSEAEKEMEILKNEFKFNIEQLIVNNYLNEAEELIEEYENILGKDSEILMLKSKLLVSKNSYTN